MALTHTDTGAHPRQSRFRPRRSPATPLEPLKANIQCINWERSRPALWRVQIPISRASSARLVCSDVDSCQPTTRRENTSVTNAAYTQPEYVRRDQPARVLN